jgi:hypothetical protein
MKKEIYRVYSLIDNSTILITGDFDEAVEAQEQSGSADICIESDRGEQDYFRELGRKCASGELDEIEIERWMDEQEFSDY